VVDDDEEEKKEPKAPKKEVRHLQLPVLYQPCPRDLHRNQ
jgi:hypothetical protein